MYLSVYLKFMNFQRIISLKWLFYFSICVSIYPCPQSPEDSFRFPGAGVSGGCVIICDCWELNSDPLQEQQVIRVSIPSITCYYDSFYHSFFLFSLFFCSLPALLCVLPLLSPAGHFASHATSCPFSFSQHLLAPSHDFLSSFIDYTHYLHPYLHT